MPSLEELLWRQPKTSSGIDTIRGVWQDPLGVAKGALINAPLGLIRSMLGLGANALQSLVPFEVPLATDKPVYGYSPTELGKRGENLLNALTLGIPGLLEQRMLRGISERGGRPQTWDEWAGLIGRSAGGTLLEDLLPGRELSALFKGEAVPGQPITGEQVGEAITTGSLKALPWLSKFGKRGAAQPFGPVARASSMPEALETAWNHARAKMPEDITIPPPGYEVRPVGRGFEIWSPGGTVESPVGLLRTVSAGEIEAQEAGKVMAGGKLGKGKPGETLADIEFGAQPPPVESLMTPSMAEHFRIKGIFEDAATRRIASQVIGTKIMDSVIDRYPGIRVNRQLATAVREGALSEPAIQDLVTTYEIPLRDLPNAIADVPKLIGEALEKTATFGGKGLQAFSEARAQLYAETVLRAQKGDKNAIRALEALERARQGEVPTTYWGKMVYFANQGVEKVRRAALVGTVVNATRNIASQGANFVLEAFENAIGGTVEAVGNLAKGKPISPAYTALVEQIFTLGRQVLPATRAKLNAVLDNAPLNALDLKNAWSYEAGANTLSNLFKGVKPEGWKGAADLTASILTTATRLQETFFRRLFFQSRLEASIRRLNGIPDFAAVVEELKKPSLRPDLREALTDATNHALKQTFAFRPQSSFARAVLSIYDKIPFSTALLPTFPRFMANSLRWQVERMPTMWFNLFTPEVQHVLRQGAETGFKSMAASQALGQATTGLMLFNSAWFVRNMEGAGPKYYQVPMGKNEKGEDTFGDTRPFQPYNTYLFLADMMKSSQTGQPQNLTPDEYTDALFNVRRMSELELFALPEQIRSARSEDPEIAARAWKTPIGQFFASFFVPLRSLGEVAGGTMGSEEWLAGRDIQGQELTGPARANIPGLSSTLPERVSPFTGEKRRPEAPLLRQFAGITKIALTELDKLIQETPKVRLSDLIGQYGSAQANRTVAEEFGNLLSTETPNGKLGDVLAKNIRALGLSPEAQKEVLQELFTELREEIRDRAMQRDPRAFVPHLINTQVEGPWREQMRKTAREMGLL